MKKLLALTALSAVFAFTACDEPKTGETPAPDGPIAVNLSADIVAPLVTRVADDQWEDNDQTGVFMLQGGSVIAENVRHLVTADGRLTAPEQIMYPETGNVSIVAYYPYFEDYENIRIDLADQSEGLAQDVLHSNNVRDLAPTSSTVGLRFNYALPKIVVTVTANEEAGLTETDFDNMNASVFGMAAGGAPDVITGLWNPVSDEEGYGNVIRMYKTGSTANSATFEALIMPSGPVGAVFEFSALRDGETQNWSIRVEKGYRPGYEYEMSFTINPEDEPGPVTYMSAQATINPRWPVASGSYVIGGNGGDPTVPDPEIAGNIIIQTGEGETAYSLVNNGFGTMLYLGDMSDRGYNLNEVFFGFTQNPDNGGFNVGFHLAVPAGYNRIVPGTYSANTEGAVKESAIIYPSHIGLPDMTTLWYVQDEGRVTVSEAVNGGDIYHITFGGCKLVNIETNQVMGIMSGYWHGRLEWIDVTEM